MLKFLVQLTFHAHNFVIFCVDCFMFSAFAIIVDTVARAKPSEGTTNISTFSRQLPFFWSPAF